MTGGTRLAQPGASPGNRSAGNARSPATSDDPLDAPTRPSRPFSCLGCGCGTAVALALAAVVTLTVINYRAAQAFRRHLDDPAARREAFARVLPFDRLPPGYRPLGGMHVPLTLDMAVLTDREPGAVAAAERGTGGEPGAQGGPGGAHPGSAGGTGAADRVGAGFVYVRMRDWFGREAKMRELFTRSSPDPGSFQQAEVEFTAREVIGRGTLRAGGAEVLYYARRGALKVDQERFGVVFEDEDDEDGEEPDTTVTYDGIATLMLFDCGDDDRLRVGLWFAAEEAKPAAAGGPGDPAALRSFLDGLRLCG